MSKTYCDAQKIFLSVIATESRYGDSEILYSSHSNYDISRYRRKTFLRGADNSTSWVFMARLSLYLHLLIAVFSWLHPSLCFVVVVVVVSCQATQRCLTDWWQQTLDIWTSRGDAASPKEQRTILGLGTCGSSVACTGMPVKSLFLLEIWCCKPASSAKFFARPKLLDSLLPSVNVQL